MSRNHKNIYRSTVETPLGPMAIAATDEALVLLEFADNPERIERHLQKHYPQHEQQHEDVSSHGQNAPYEQAVKDYFSGKKHALSDLACEPAGTDFQRQVWQGLQQIPVGETLSYGELASRLAKPGASRAVGLANGRNPIALVIPCHRVIGTDGSLTGYAGGMERKRWLLAHEASGDLL